MRTTENRLTLRLIVFLTAFPFLGLGIGTAIAQSVRSNVLTSIAISDGNAGETRVILNFNETLPQYTIISNDSGQATIAFVGTVRGQAASAPTGNHGVLRSLAFVQDRTMLTVVLTGAAPIHISATPIAGRAVSLSITTATHADSEAPPTSLSGSPPQAAWTTNEDAGNSAFEVVPLRYADVSEVVGLLTSAGNIKPNDSFNPQEPAFGSAGMTNSYGGGTAPSMFNPNGSQNGATTEESLGQTIDESIGVDRRLNAVILRGSPELVASLKEKIAQLDVPVTSVVLETVFVELTEKGAKNIGLDFNNSSSQVAVVSYGSGTFDSGGLGNGSAGRISASLQAAIYAQVQQGQGEIISKPRIAAQSGSSAKIVTGDALPILTSITLSGVNGVSQQVQYVNVGVTLQIAPRVSDDGYVTSHVFCEVSSVTGFSQGYPTISQREASTSATVKDGESFTIGGLSQVSKLSTDNKIPLLSDVPLVGSLFGLFTGTTSKTDLYIIVTPHIVRGSDAAAAEMLKTAH